MKAAQIAKAFVDGWMKKLLTPSRHSGPAKFHMVTEFTPVGRHSTNGQTPQDAAVAVFMGPVNRKGERKLFAVELRRKVMFPRGKDYHGKIGFKTQQRREAYKEFHGVYGS